MNPQHSGERREFAATKEAAQRLGLTVRYFPVSSETELEAAFADIARERDDAILAFADGFTLQFAGRIAEFSQQKKIPAIDGWEPFARAGNVMTYGPLIQDVYRRLAEYVDKTLAICMRCGAPANRTQRLVSSRDRVVVGGAHEYEARCRRCHDTGARVEA